MEYEFYLLLAAGVSFLISLIFSIYSKSEKIGTLFIFTGIAFQLLLLIMRSYFAKHPPFTNLYETMILLPFLFSMRLVLWKKQVAGNAKYAVLFLVLVLDSVAMLLPSAMKTIKPLMPALNSLWMYIHVPAYFVAYSSMLVATVLAIMVLLDKGVEIVKKLDEEVKIAFFFLNTGMISGAIWAYFSWGTYWGWDVKEVWSLINILILSFYFHNNQKDIVPKAVIVIFTFITIIFTYIGVTFILPGLHSYA